MGKICIIVTTNKKREFLNNKKLTDLLRNDKDYSCDSVDLITNLPNGPKLTEKIKENPSNTGNLPDILRIKVNAPVVLTSNHRKGKYRDDGIMNGARGYVVAIQVNKKNPDKVEIIWVVFHNEEIGKLYRHDHQHLRKNFNPGHHLATPILPERKSFNVKGGNVQNQRTNFPITRPGLCVNCPQMSR